MSCTPPESTIYYNSDLSQIGFYCVGDQQYGPPCGMVPGSESAAADNALALQNLVKQVMAAGGGTILIPSGTYYISGTIVINPDVHSPPITNAFSLRIMGTGETALIQVAEDANIFDVDINTTSGDESLGNILFQDLILQYSPSGVFTQMGVALNLGAASGGGCHNASLLRVTFLNCPQAIVTANTLSFSVIDCVISYNDAYAGGTPPVGITIGQPKLDSTNNGQSNETYIANVTLQSIASSDGGPGGTGILIQNADEVRIVDVQIESFETGIAITPSAGPPAEAQEYVAHVFFGNVAVFTVTQDDTGASGQALLIQPQGSAYVTQAVFHGCTFQPTIGATTAYTGGGILVDQSLTTKSVDQLRFVSCYSGNWPGFGLEITSGQNIEVIGGAYSGNGIGSSPSLESAGIAITGPATAIRIIGVICGNSTLDASTGEEPSATQECGILIIGGATNVIVDGCDLSGNLLYGVSVIGGSEDVSPSDIFIRNCNVLNNPTPIEISGPVSNVQVTSCAGYNDQVKLLANTLPSGSFNGVGFSYYGPVTFYVSGTGVTDVYISASGFILGNSTGLTQGAFRLEPGQWAHVTTSVGASPNFIMIGD